MHARGRPGGAGRFVERFLHGKPPVDSRRARKAPAPGQHHLAGGFFPYSSVRTVEVYCRKSLRLEGFESPTYGSVGRRPLLSQAFTVAALLSLSLVQSRACEPPWFA